MTDTSYFPTEDLDQVPDLPAPREPGNGAAKDLAFLGYTYVHTRVKSRLRSRPDMIVSLTQLPPIRNALRLVALARLMRMILMNRRLLFLSLYFITLACNDP
jgi:hypothetical protein